jgi:uncharacterized protein YukE
VSQERLRETLAELRRELSRADAADADARERVQQAAREIDAWLERAEAPEESLPERLREAVVRFEEEHPRLSATLQRVVDALSDLGI